MGLVTTMWLTFLVAYGCIFGVMSCSVGDPCPGDHEECKMIEEKGNLAPECVCVAGYGRVDDVCTDINECVHPELNTCNGEIETCLNEDGTFTCECKPQFVDGDSCNPDVATPPPYSCGQRPALGRVVGGHDSTEGASPWIGSLRDGTHSCGATLIDQTWAITAAHCIGYFNEIVLGDLKLDSVSPYHQTKTVRVFQHPDYNDTGAPTNDIALLMLSPLAQISNYVRPACLATSHSEVSTYKNCFIAGWGATSEGGAGSNILQEAAVDLITEEKCRGFYNETYDPEAMICAGFAEGGIDTCQGDSGGPLVCQGENNLWHLVGVTSFGQGCARPGYPGVYTRVSKYTSFIEDLRNYDFEECSDGTIVLPRDICDYTQHCQGGSDESECEAIPVGATISVSYPDYLEHYPDPADVVYLISGESGSQLYIQINLFQLEDGYEQLYVGYGSSPNDNSVIATFTEAVRYRNILIEDNAGWLRFMRNSTFSRASFQAQITAFASDDLVECSDGAIFLPSHVCDYTQNCKDGSDEAECDAIPTGKTISLSSPYYPDYYPNSADVVYLIPGESGSKLYIQFDDFFLDYLERDKLYIGYGSSPSDNSTVAVLSGTETPGNMIIENNVGWLRFTSDDDHTLTGFHVQISVIASNVKTFNCSNGNVLLTDLFCNQIVDCPDKEDETDCELLPDGSSFTFESPNYPNEYPNDYTITYLFIAEDSLRIKLTFDHFDLETRFDTLTIGYGLDPNEDSTLGVLTGPFIPDEISSPTSTMWMTFATDYSVTNTGFRLNVTVFKGPDCDNPPFEGSQEEICEFAQACIGHLNPTCTPVGASKTLVSSANYPESYDPNLMAISLFVAPLGYNPVLNITDFVTEDSFDTLTIRSHRGIITTLTGNDVGLPYNVTSPDRVLEMIFETDYSVAYRGYTGYVYTVLGDESLTSNE